MQIEQLFSSQTQGAERGKKSKAQRQHKGFFAAEHQFSDDVKCRAENKSGSNERGAGVCNKVEVTLCWGPTKCPMSLGCSRAHAVFPMETPIKKL